MNIHTHIYIYIYTQTAIIITPASGTVISAMLIRCCGSLTQLAGQLRFSTLDMPSPFSGEDPASRPGWEQAARQNKLDSETIALKRLTYHSASKLAFEEFSHLRILVLQYGASDFKVKGVIGGKAYNERQWNDFSELGKVVSACGKNDPLGIVEPSMYAMVQYLTHLVMLKEPADMSYSPKT